MHLLREGEVGRDGGVGSGSFLSRAPAADPGAWFVSVYEPWRPPEALS